MMRWPVVLAGGLAVILLAGIVLMAGRSDPSSSTVPPPPPGALMVDELRRDPGDSSEEVRVQGIVGATNVERRQFGLIDQREVEACGSVDCAEFILPVSWDGDLPAVYDLVLVTGRVQETGNGLVLAASEVVSQ